MEVRMLVVGAGAVGAYFAALLSKRYGNEILLLARNESYRAISRNGVVLKNGKRQAIRVQVAKDVSAISGADYIMLATKLYDLEPTLRQLAGLLRKAKGVFGLQNGLGKEQAIARFTGTRPIYAATYVSSEKVSPGVISHVRETPKVVLGEIDNSKSRRVLEVSGMLRRSGIDCAIPKDTLTEMWMKFVRACAINGVCAAARCSAGSAVKYEPTRRLLACALNEGLSVAGAYLGGIPAERKRAVLAEVSRASDYERPSTMVDLANGRRTEIEFLNGAMVRKARAKHIPVPVNEAIYAIVSAQEATVKALN